MTTIKIFLSILVLLYCAVNALAIENPKVISRKNLIEQIKVEDYTVEVYLDRKTNTDGVIRVLKGKNVVFEEQGHQYQIGTYDNENGNAVFRSAKDITGDGAQEVVIAHWSGGAHCCYDFKVFSLADEFLYLAGFQVNDASGSTFKDVDGDGIYEFMTNDFTFAYWNASFAGSPAPQVILRFKDGQYKVAYDLMSQPMPTPDEERKYLIQDKAEIARLCSEEIWAWHRDGVCVTSDIWTYMLKLIFTGHPEEAWAFLDRKWTGSPQAKEWFIYDFKRRLVSSPYAEALPINLFGFEAVATDRWSDYAERMAKQLREMK